MHVAVACSLGIRFLTAQLNGCLRLHKITLHYDARLGIIARTRQPVVVSEA
jgi:hypothetical protein